MIAIQKSFDVVDSAAAESTGPAVMQGLQKIEHLVDELTASWVNSRSLLSRRSHRVTFHREIAIAALCDETLLPLGSPKHARSWDISHAGMSFAHTQPLCCRFVAVTIPTNLGAAESLVLRLNWCRFTRDGVYRSGGKFARMQRFGWERGLDLADLAKG